MKNLAISDIVILNEDDVLNPKNNLSIKNNGKKRMLVVMKIDLATKEFVGFPITSKESISFHTKIQIKGLTSDYDFSYVETKAIRLKISKIVRNEKSLRIPYDKFQELQKFSY